MDALLRPTHGAGGAAGSGETGRLHGLVSGVYGLRSGGATSAVRAAGPMPAAPPASPDERRTAWLRPPSPDRCTTAPSLRTGPTPLGAEGVGPDGGAAPAAGPDRRPRPPGGERPGRLPGPHGSDRLASGVPLPAPPTASRPAGRASVRPALPATVGTARRDTGGPRPLKHTGTGTARFRGGGARGRRPTHRPHRPRTIPHSSEGQPCTTSPPPPPRPPTPPGPAPAPSPARRNRPADLLGGRRRYGIGPATR